MKQSVRVPQDALMEIAKSHGRAIDCLVCTYIKETGYKAKDLKVVYKIGDRANGVISEITVAHKNTPNKYL